MIDYNSLFKNSFAIIKLIIQKSYFKIIFEWFSYDSLKMLYSQMPKTNENFIKKFNAHIQTKNYLAKNIQKKNIWSTLWKILHVYLFIIIFQSEKTMKKNVKNREIFFELRESSYKIDKFIYKFMKIIFQMFSLSCAFSV